MSPAESHRVAEPEGLLVTAGAGDPVVSREPNIVEQNPAQRRARVGGSVVGRGIVGEEHGAERGQAKLRGKVNVGIGVAVPVIGQSRGAELCGSIGLAICPIAAGQG